MRDGLFTPDAVAFLRKRIAERLREVARTGQSDLDERVERLRRTEQRIHGLVKFIADGDESKHVRETLRDLGAQARIDGAAIEEMTRAPGAPISLPTPDVLLKRAHDLEGALAADPLRAREALRGVFEDGRISVHPQPDGSHVVEGTFLPLVAMAAAAPRLRRGPTARRGDAFGGLEEGRRSADEGGRAKAAGPAKEAMIARLDRTLDPRRSDMRVASSDAGRYFPRARSDRPLPG